MAALEQQQPQLAQLQFEPEEHGHLGYDHQELEQAEQAPRFEYCEPVPEPLRCPVCNDAFIDAIMCSLCDPPTTFCRRCLASRLDKCTRCDNLLSRERREVFDNPVATHMADTLRVYCRYRVGGCHWQGERRRLGEHCGECSKRPSVCIHCGRCRAFEWISRHQDRCGHRLVTCTACGRDNVQARCLKYHARQRCARRSLAAERDELKEILSRLQARDPGLKDVILEISSELKAEARELEIAEADARDREWEVIRVFGSEGGSSGQFQNPRGVAVDQEGRIIVVDQSNHRVQVMSHDGKMISKFGSHGSGDGQFKTPCGVAIDQEGHIIVADMRNHRVQAMSRDGKVISKFGSYGSGDGQLKSPAGVAIDQDGHIIVADYDNHRVQVMSRDGKMISKFGTEGSGDGQFKNPCGVAIDQEGHIIVADESNHRVQVMSHDGKMISKFGSHGSGDGQFKTPCGVAIDQEGHIIIVEYNNHRVQVMSRDGKMISKFGSQGSRDGQFKNPYGVAIDQEGHIIVTDQVNHRVQVLRMPRVLDA